jgi:hypothetical protein
MLQRPPASLPGPATPKNKVLLEVMAHALPVHQTPDPTPEQQPNDIHLAMPNWLNELGQV